MSEMERSLLSPTFLNVYAFSPVTVKSQEISQVAASFSLLPSLAKSSPEIRSKESFLTMRYSPLEAGAVPDVFNKYFPPLVISPASEAEAPKLAASINALAIKVDNFLFIIDKFKLII